MEVPAEKIAMVVLALFENIVSMAKAVDKKFGQKVAVHRAKL